VTYWKNDVLGDVFYKSAERSAEIIEEHLQARREALAKGRDLPTLPIQHVHQTITSKRDGQTAKRPTKR